MLFKLSPLDKRHLSKRISRQVELLQFGEGGVGVQKPELVDRAQEVIHTVSGVNPERKVYFARHVLRNKECQSTTVYMSFKSS